MIAFPGRRHPDPLLCCSPSFGRKKKKMNKEMRGFLTEQIGNTQLICNKDLSMNITLLLREKRNDKFFEFVNETRKHHATT